MLKWEGYMSFFTTILLLSSPDPDPLTMTIEKLEKPDEVVSLMPGDKILSLDDKNFYSFGHIEEFKLNWGREKEVVFLFKRGQEQKMVQLKPSQWNFQWRPELDETSKKLYTESLSFKEQERCARFRAIAEVLTRRKEKGKAAWFYLETGRIYIKNEEFDLAIDNLQKIVSLSVENNDRWFTALGLKAIAQSYRQSLRFLEAEKYYLQALKLYHVLYPDSIELAGVYNDLAVTYSYMGNIDNAVSNFSSALKINEKHIPLSLPTTSNIQNLGSLYCLREEYNKAESLLLKAKKTQADIDPHSHQYAAILSNLGELRKNMGDLSVAKEYHLEALAIKEDIEDDLKAFPSSFMGSFTNLGIIFALQGEFDVAEQYFYKRLKIIENNPIYIGKFEHSQTFVNLGNLYREKGELEKAEKALLASLGFLEKIERGDKDILYARVLNNLASVYMQQRNWNKARHNLQEAEARCMKGTQNKGLLSNILHNQGLILFENEDFLGAKRKFLDADKNLIFKDRIEGVRIYTSLGFTEEKLGNISEAIDYYHKGLEALENQRKNISGSYAKELFIDRFHNYYTDCVRAQIKAGKYKEAIHTIERARAKNLLDLLSKRWLNIEKMVPKEIAKELRELKFKRSQLVKRLEKSAGKITSQQYNDLFLEYKRLEATGDVYQKLYNSHPEFASLIKPTPLDYRGVKEALDPGTLALIYLFDTSRYFDRNTILLKILKTEEDNLEISVTTLPICIEELEQNTQELIGRIKKGFGSWKRLAEKLYELLIKPAEKEIQLAQRLLIIPDAGLHLLPFSALIQKTVSGPQKILGQMKPISMSFSITLYNELKTKLKNTGNRIVGFGDPIYPDEAPGMKRGTERYQGIAQQHNELSPLPKTKDEIKILQNLFGENAELYLGSQANKKNVKSLSSPVKYIHFACHGIINEQFPMNSALVFSANENDSEEDDGYLYTWEIFEDLNLDAELVVLSACNTGLGQRLRGEGILGLSRAFFYAGARSLVVSLWPVSDESSVLFMKKFYQELSYGNTKDIALQKAQKALMNDYRFSHPYYWASFVFHGPN